MSDTDVMIAMRIDAHTQKKFVACTTNSTTNTESLIILLSFMHANLRLLLLL